MKRQILKSLVIKENNEVPFVIDKSTIVFSEKVQSNKLRVWYLEITYDDYLKD